MGLDLVSIKEFQDLEFRVSQLEKDKEALVQQLDKAENRLDFLITLLKHHLSPLDKRKLENKLQLRGYF